MDTINSEFLQLTRDQFRELRQYGDKSFAQITEEGMHWTPDVESNSIAVIIQHLHGNMRSRWTDFFSSDLEKPDRNRDGEFEPRKLSKAELLALWDEGWGYVSATMDELAPDDLNRMVAIRGVDTSALKAINRQIAHYAYHVGQIVYIAKHLASAEWQTLSIARGKSGEYVPDPKTGK
ncbi:MAG TPA: DUF1572 family protein [Candidatus Kapabacteria bacterium]|nr:DUF1572 family protein [Candidatus Kapabacteria bacterium]